MRVAWPCSVLVVLSVVAAAQPSVENRELDGKPFLKYRAGSEFFDTKEAACAKISPKLAFKSATEDGEGFVTCKFDIEENKQKSVRELGGVKHVVRCPPNASEQRRNNDASVSGLFCLCQDRFVAAGNACVAKGDTTKPAPNDPLTKTEQFQITLYRGTTQARRTEATTTDHDLGPGVYYAATAAVARSHAQARYLEAWKPNTTPLAIVLTAKLEVPKARVLDFSTGSERASFEAHVRAQKDKVAVGMLDGATFNPVKFHALVTSWLATKQQRLSSFAVVVAPDYRFADKQIRIIDPTIVNQLDRAAIETDKNVGAPEVTDLVAAFRGTDVTGDTTERCAATSKAGSCGVWPDRAGRVLFERRGWQSVVYNSAGKDGDHKHLRVGELIVDGTFMQFDLDARNTDKGELFIGTKAQLVTRLGAIKRPTLVGADGSRLFAAYWNGEPKTGQTRLLFTSAGVATWATP